MHVNSLKDVSRQEGLHYMQHDEAFYIDYIVVYLLISGTRDYKVQILT
jgi:hypothetical protein